MSQECLMYMYFIAHTYNIKKPPLILFLPFLPNPPLPKKKKHNKKKKKES